MTDNTPTRATVTPQQVREACEAVRAAEDSFRHYADTYARGLLTNMMHAHRATLLAAAEAWVREQEKQ